MSFRVSHSLKISPFTFDNVDWFEFLWQFERLSREIEQTNIDNANSGHENQLMGMVNGSVM